MENSIPADPDPMGKVIKQLKTDIDRMVVESRATPGIESIPAFTMWQSDTVPVEAKEGDIWLNTGNRQKWWDTRTQQWLDHPPVTAASSNNGGKNPNLNGSNTYPPFSINLPPLSTAPLSPGAWSYNYGAPTNTSICPRCGQSRSVNDMRQYVARDGTSKNACIDCIEGTTVGAGTKALINANTQILLERAAAYVQICNEGGDWMLVDKQPELSRDLLEAIRHALGKDAKWDPSQLRRDGKI